MKCEKRKYYLGVDIGGTKCAVVLGDGEFNIYRKVQFATQTHERGFAEIIEELFVKSEMILTDINQGQLHRIGISCGGPLSSSKGIILSPPNLPGWKDVPIVKLFSERFGVEAALQNDANACALAEWQMGAGKGTQNMVFLTFGTGMGAGLILNGKLYSGTNDLGGEVGHIRLASRGPVGFGKAGSFEGFCSGGGIARLAKSMVSEKLKRGIPVGFCPTMDETDQLDALKVAQAAWKGDETALAVIQKSAEFLGRGLAVLIDVLNPECIVIGSIYARNEVLFKRFMEPVIHMEAIPEAAEVCKIVPATLGDAIGDYAALCVAVYEDVYNTKPEK